MVENVCKLGSLLLDMPDTGQAHVRSHIFLPHILAKPSSTASSSYCIHLIIFRLFTLYIDRFNWLGLILAK